MSLFGKSFEEKVQEAVTALNKADLGVRNIRATAAGKIVTLDGLADSLEAKGRVMAEFNKLVDTENTVNKIQIQGRAAAPAAQPPAPQIAAEQTLYEVKSGDTLGAIAQRFYGKASLYPKIFEANRDILSNPDLIKVGQKLKIPK
jgi:nucleoid-associated protein YgaU